MPDALRSDVYVWAKPDDLDDGAAAERLEAWEAAGGDPAASPFEPSIDLGWFVRELVGEHPSLELITDAVPRTSSTPIWMSGSDEPPARLVAVTFGGAMDREVAADVLESIVSLAAKYDLSVLSRHDGRVHHPLAELAAVASATFWPGGAIQAAVAGLGGLGLAVIAYLLSIPVLSGLAIVVGGFLFVMAIVTFGHEAAVRLRR